MDHSRSRPALPGSTPSPAPLGKTSVYQGTELPRFEESYLAAQKRAKEEQAQMVLSEGQLAQVGNITLNEFTATQQHKSQMKVVQKMLSKLPYNVREQAEAIFNMAMDTAETASVQLETYRREVLQLKQEINKMHAESEIHNRKVSMYQQKLASVEAISDVHKEDVDTKNHFHLRNKHILSKVSSTNRMLMRSLQALQEEDAPSVQPMVLRTSSAEGFRSGTLPPMEGVVSAHASTDAFDTQGQGGVMVSRPGTNGQQPTGTPGKAGGHAVAGSSGPLEKLRESLLRVTREHGKATKQSDNFEREVRSLKKNLKETLNINRQLKSELDELKSIKSGDNAARIAPPVVTALAPAEFAASSSKPSSSGSEKIPLEDQGGGGGGGANAPYRPRLRNFGKMDDRFTALLKRDALEPLEGIKIMRRVLAFMASAPPATSAIACANYIVGRDLTKIFDSEIASIHLLGSSMNECYKTDTLLKFTQRTSDPESFTSREYRGSGIVANEPTSVAWETIRTGHSSRLNSLGGRTNNNFNRLVDGIPGTLTKRLLTLPLRNVNTNETIGCLSLINKCNPSDAFTESDELMCLLLCDQASALLTQCFVHERVLTTANIFRATMESAVRLYNVIPPKEAITAERVFTPGVLLNEIEEVARAALKCKRARAFILSKYIAGFEPGLLVYGNAARKASSSAKDADNDHMTASNISSVAGRVSISGEVVVIFSEDVRPVRDASQADPSKLNPMVDLALDTASKVIVTIPIMDKHGEIFGVVQLVPSAASPPFDIKEKFENQEETLNVVYFPQAAQWMGFQMSQSFKHLVHYIGRRVHGPVFCPLEFFQRQVATASIGGEQSVEDEDASVQSMEPSNAFDVVEPVRPVSSKVEHALGLKVLAGSSPVQLVAEAEARSAQLTEELNIATQQLLTLTDKLQQERDKARSQTAVFESTSAQLAAMTLKADTAKTELSAQIDTLKAENNLLKTVYATKPEVSVTDDSPALIAARQAQKVADARIAVLEKELSAAATTNSALTDQLVRMADASLSGIDRKTAKLAVGAAAPAAPAADTLEATGVPREAGLPEARDDIKDSFVVLAAGGGTAPATRPTSNQSARPQSRERPLSAKPPSTPAPANSKPGSAGGGIVNTVHVTGSLPGTASEWQSAQDDQGNTYYYNNKTGATSWELPVESTGGFTESTDAFVGVTFGDWSQMFTPEGIEYWVNNVSGESVWTLPQDVTDQFTQEQISARPNSSKVVASAGGYEIEL